MDFEIFFYLLLAVVYVLYQLVEARRSSSEEQPSPADRRPDHEPAEHESRHVEQPSAGGGNEMDEALREIRRALGMERPAPPPPPAPGPERERPAAPELERPLRPPTEEPREGRPRPVTDDEWLQEETLEGLPEVMTPPTTPTAAPSPGYPGTPARYHDLVRRLRTPGAAREAVLTSEILGPPRARKPLDRGRR